MGGVKRKISSSMPETPPLRRSKRLAESKDAPPISVGQFSDGGDNEEMIVSSAGESDEMCRSLSHADSDSDGETDGGSESHSDSGAIKLPNLNTFESRPVIEERSVALGQLKKMSRIPEILKDLGLHGICTYRGRVNITLVREFFAGINPFKVDKGKRVLVSTVRGHFIRVTPDLLAEYRKISRPLIDSVKQYPYLPDVQMPTYHDIWMTLCHGSWPPEDMEDNPNPKILLNMLKKDFVLLHHIFWWNVHPKSPRRELNSKQAMLLHAVYNGFKLDIPTMWWDSIYDDWTNDHPIASLPLGHLLTGFMHKGRRLPDLNKDKWGKEKVAVIDAGTIGKSEGQSKLHRVVNNPISMQGLHDMLLTMQENQIAMWEVLKMVDRVVYSTDDEDERHSG